MALVLALDVGGTYIKSAVYDLTYLEKLSEVEINRERTRVESDNGEALLRQLVEIIQRVKEPLDAVGIVAPGIIDAENKVIKYSTNLKVNNFALAERLSQAVGISVKLNHDGRGATLAEQELGAGRGLSNFAFLPIGTGISVGLVIDGEIRSARGLLGEIGHANCGHLEKCVCGLVGCFEAVASTKAIEDRYAALSGEKVSTTEVFTRAQNSDKHALEIWNCALDAIQFTCDWLMNTLAPEAIVIGGGLSRIGEPLRIELQTRIEKRISFQQPPKILLAHFGDNAGCIGAALATKALL